MAKRKQQKKSPQPNHKPNQQKSQFDKRARLDQPNPERCKTMAAKIPLVGSIATMAASMANLLDSRIAFRFSIIMAGMMLADDRRVAAAWFATAGVQDDWDRFYDCLQSIGRSSESLASSLLWIVLAKFDPGADGHLTVAIDDSPTPRYGKHVEGAGVHHNPTPGPVGSEWLYGHNWVTMCLLVSHGAWGVIALPLLSLLYVRIKDVPALAEKYEWKFRTKHEMAIELVTWFVQRARSAHLVCQIWLVADGAYVARHLLKAMMDQGVTVFSRLRCDAILFDLPPAKKSGQRGRPRKYGTNRVSLKKRAGQKRGWETLTYSCRGEDVTRSYKTFLATSHLTGGVIRVVIVQFDGGAWAAYFCTNGDVSVRDILETISSRWAIEEFFHDTKEVWGAGQQQVRNVWSNIGCWNLNQWMYTLVELTAWDSTAEEICDRRNRPWDNPDRRPSHADRRSAISREMLRKQFSVVLPDGPEQQKIQPLLDHLIGLAT